MAILEKARLALVKRRLEVLLGVDLALQDMSIGIDYG
jgi:hypothetical protein